jgi:hypothetical protein
MTSETRGNLSVVLRLLDRWTVAAALLVIGYLAFSFFALQIAIENHSGGLGSSIMDGMDGLAMTDKWDLQANLRESRIFMQLIMWGFYPASALFKLICGDTWQAMYLMLGMSIVTVTSGACMVFIYSREVLRDSLVSFLLVVLYFLLPAVFANTVYWYGQPPFLLLMGALYIMRWRLNWVAVPVVILASGCHPVSVPVFAGLAWAAFKAPLRGNPPLMPGFDRRDAVAARNWRLSLILCVVLTVWAIILVVGSRAGVSVSQRGLLWDFFIGKFHSAVIPTNLVQVFFFFLPMLFLPLSNAVWLPAVGIALAYGVFGSQGVVTGFSLPLVGFSMLAMVHRMQGLVVNTRRTVVVAAIVTAVGVNLFVPWPNLFPLMVEPLTGGALSPSSWVVNPQEAAINKLIEEKIPENTKSCLSTWQIGPVLAQRCQKVTALSFPFRRQTYELKDFLDIGDRGRIAAGHWDFILVDLRRERNSVGLDVLIRRIQDAGKWEVAGRTGEVVLYRRIAQGVGAKGLVRL